MTNHSYDIVIVGGGMVGASLACALANEDVSIALIEAVSISTGQQPSYDDRGLALSLASQKIFNAFGLWPDIAVNANPIKHVHVSDKGRFGFVRLHADMLNLEALGYVVIARELGQALMSRVEQSDNIDFICPASVEQINHERTSVQLTLSNNDETQAISTRLLVVADGAHSRIRQQLGIETRSKHYGQTAIVSNITPEHAHEDTAYERFTESGPLAVLPHSQQRCVVVHSVHSEQVNDCMELDDEAFLQRLQERFGRRLGRFSKLGKRTAYPLLLIEPQEQVRDRIVLLGNSAHAIHPNGAQGFNLCLRDIAVLSEHLLAAIHAGDDPGNRSLLDAYVASRLPDQQRVIRLSDRLATVFSSQQSAFIAARNIGMLLTDLVPPLKRCVIQQGIGFWGRQATMLREVS